MNQQHYDDEIDLIYYIRVVYKRGIFIIALVFVSMLFAAVTNLRKPAMYEASATFFPISVREYHGSSSETSAMKSKIGIEGLVISILESRKMAEKIIEQLDLKKAWKIKYTHDAQMALKGATGITLEKNGIIKLSVRTNSPELSANIANAYVDNLDYFNRELELGAQKQIVQVIDRATVPERRMPRGTVKGTLLAGFGSFIFAVFLAFLIEFAKRIDIKKILKEK